MNTIYKKFIVIICFSLLLLSIGFKIMNVYSETTYDIEYESIDTSKMASTKIANKETKKDNSIITEIIKYINNSSLEANTLSSLKEVELPKKSKDKKENTTVEQVIEQPSIIWRLPTEYGTITTNPNYGHIAYDIISPRGSRETIYPVADGYVSGIYRDSAGALVVTVFHNAFNFRYTSLYAHLSSYAKDLHLGMRVDTNTALGQMGSTGNSTGVHLHIALLDCGLFDPNDPFCKDLNGFFNYSKIRLSQGFIGLGSVINMPASWQTR